MTTRSVLIPRGASTAETSSLASGMGGVQIAHFPQMLCTRSGDPDSLFVPLLDAAREARQMVERLSGHGEEKTNAASLAGMQLASVLLKSSIFSLVARGQKYEHAYSIDLAEDLFTVSTRLYATVSRRTSLFKVEMSGKISGGPFAVRNAAQGAVIVQADERHLRTPGYFATELARECLKAQIEQQRFGQMEESASAHASDEVRLILDSANRKIPVLLRQKRGTPTTSWQIIDARSQEWVGTLPGEAENHLKRIIAYLEELFLNG
jgi:hypothetical protein